MQQIGSDESREDIKTSSDSVSDSEVNAETVGHTTIYICSNEDGESPTRQLTTPRNSETRIQAVQVPAIQVMVASTLQLAAPVMHTGRRHGCGRKSIRGSNCGKRYT